MKNKIKIVCAFFLLMSFSWQSVAKTIIYFNFIQNQKTLANTVCVNKGKPKSCCEAKCYLDKEIKKEDSRQNNLPAGLKDKIEKTELLSEYKKFNFFSEVEIEKTIFSYLVNIPKCFSKKVFQPPQIIIFS